MPGISVGSQIFDLVFHPSHSTVYTALLSGKVKAIAYDQEGRSKQLFSIKISKKSCRGITANEDGSRLYVVGKGKGLHTIDTTTEKLVESKAKAHETPINRVKHVAPWLLATGDDDGVIKLWDPRKNQPIRTYTQHFDYITDFLWLEDKKHLVSTSGDGTLSVIDVRSTKSEPFAHSEDQEDELLSIVPIKGATKVLVGTQLGIISVFNRSSGWGDCVDRIPGHPSSVDALCTLPQSLPDVDTSTVVLTGSSDGFMRAVEVFPTKLHGVVADHGDWPVERIAVGEGLSQLSLNDEDEDHEDEDGDAEIVRKNSSKTRVNKKEERKPASDGEVDEDEDEKAGSSGHWWAGSVGHDEVLKLTDLNLFFNKPTVDVEDPDAREDSDSDEDEAGHEKVGAEDQDDEEGDEGDEATEVVPEKDDSDDSEEEVVASSRKRKKNKDPLAVKKKKGRNELEVEGTFFNDL
ncbi:hypothetical protein D9758_000832 [Tetrapyrgos nigripes]|uniref:WD repeat-containing protein JIP5 n=1 Tax=Tetrapyrgos nigripes TaxID=182062 RepID=A0A8H5GYV4_9AGAR|nr:hypothetical protein D9758_000832 [Tetrapyrgos nigripes]